MIKPFIKNLIVVFTLALTSFATYLLCYHIAEKYFFDRFFYKKSAEFGYYVPNSQSISFVDRNKGMSLLQNEGNQVPVANSGDFKIAIIGDSYVFGYGIKNENRFAKILENKLNKIKPTKVISLSETSSSPINYLDWYKKLKVNSPVDLYIFTLVDNDAYIRPNTDMTPFDTGDIVKKCQSEHPTITPILDTSLRFFYQGISRDDASSNQIASDEYISSWSNPINLCVLDASLGQLPTDNSIYFIPDNYNDNSDKYQKYQDYLDKYKKQVVSSINGKNMLKYKKYWDNPYQHFTVSHMEQHPNQMANQMYADVLFNEITSNPKWQFKSGK